MRRHILQAACAVLVFGHALPAGAKNISISMTPRPALRDGVLTVQLTVRNLGDEAAQSVVPTLYFGAEHARGKGTPALPPQGTFEETLTLPAADVGSGRWPYRVTIDYTDAHQYPFQALHVLLITVGSPPSPKLAVSVPKIASIATSGLVQIRLKNLAPVPRAAAVRVLVPEGLEMKKPTADVQLAGSEEQTIALPVINGTALAGSGLPVFVTAQYDDEGTHHAVVSQGLVEIVSTQSVLERRRYEFYGAAAVLMIVWAGYVAIVLLRRL